MVTCFVKFRSIVAMVACLVLGAFVGLLRVPSAGAQGSVAGVVTERVSVGAGGEEGNAASYVQSSGQLVSADGRFVVFNSLASNLVPNEAGVRDVFVRDRFEGTTELVSVTLGGVSAGYSAEQAISANGKTVAFGSLSPQLVGQPVPAWVFQLYVRDLVSGRTELVSVDSSGTPGEADSENPNLSADGRFVVFSSFASNLAPGSSRGVRQVYVHDRVTGTTERVSVDGTGVAGNGNSDRPAISLDGNVAAFDSRATNFLASDRNGAYEDVFVHDRRTGITELASVSPKGLQSGYSWIPSLSADGLKVAYESNAPDGCETSMCVFVRDRVTGTTIVASVSSTGEPAEGPSGGARLSADAHFVAFYSNAGNLDAGDSNDDYDVFVRDLHAGVTRLASRADSGAQGNARSFNPSLSADGLTVAFESWASTLDPDDRNGAADVFVRDANPEGGPCDDSLSWNPECDVTVRSVPAPSFPTTDPRAIVYPPSSWDPRAVLAPSASIVSGSLACDQRDGGNRHWEPMQQVRIEIPGYGTTVTDSLGSFVLAAPIDVPEKVRVKIHYEGTIWGDSTGGLTEIGSWLQVMDDDHDTRVDELEPSGSTASGRSLELGTIPVSTVDCDLWVLGTQALQDYHHVTKEIHPAGKLRIKRWWNVSTCGTSSCVRPMTFFDYITIPTNFNDVYTSIASRKRTIFHEFGHTVRHVLSSGDSRAKWSDDSFRFTYGNHWDIANMGEAFNEGFGTYWNYSRAQLRTQIATPIDGRPSIAVSGTSVGSEYLDWNEYWVAERLLQLSDVAGKALRQPGESSRDAGDRIVVQVLKSNPGAIYTLYDFEVKLFELLGQPVGRPAAPESCPPGYDEHLVTCSNRSTNRVIVQTSYPRGVGVPIASCPEGMEEDAGLCYETCALGYDGVATRCYQECPAGYTDDGLTCRNGWDIFGQSSYDRGVGTPLTCDPGLEYDAGLCYTPCLSHYEGWGPGCWY